MCSAIALETLKVPCGPCAPCKIWVKGFWNPQTFDRQPEFVLSANTVSPRNMWDGVTCWASKPPRASFATFQASPSLSAGSGRAARREEGLFWDLALSWSSFSFKKAVSVGELVGAFVWPPVFKHKISVPSFLDRSYLLHFSFLRMCD